MLRLDAGLSTLRRSSLLERLAQAHARDMGLRNYFSHTTPEGLSIWDRLNLLGPPPYGDGGENIAGGQERASEVVNEWMASSGHRALLLNRNVNAIGVGVYYDRAAGNNPIYACADLIQFR